jgi:2-phosphosulfolactate phosphatase
MSFDVFFLPTLTSPKELADRTVVVIDVLRATTTITRALSVGAKEVIPCLEIDEALRIAATMSEQVVLGGERGGRRIEGFDLGNSPDEYTADSVGNKTLVFTTTNGTRAMRLCHNAKRVLLASFNNLSAVAAELRVESSIALLCAGTDGHVTREDILLAGAIMRVLVDLDAAFRPGDLEASLSPLTTRWNDEAYLAWSAWQEIVGREEDLLLPCLLESRGGRNLVELGMTQDVESAAQIDSTNVVGELLLKPWRIRSITTIV